MRKVLSAEVEWLQCRYSAFARLIALVIGAAYLIVVGWQPLSEFVQGQEPRTVGSPAMCPEGWGTLGHYCEPPPCFVYRAEDSVYRTDDEFVAAWQPTIGGGPIFYVYRGDDVSTSGEQVKTVREDRENDTDVLTSLPPKRILPRYYVQWRPATAEIAFADYSDGEFEGLKAFDTAGWRLRTLAARERSDASVRHSYGIHADISPDGGRIVYTSCDYVDDSLLQGSRGGSEDQDSRKYRGHYYEIAVMSLDDPGVTKRLTADDFSDFFPMWSPDGKSIAFLSDGSVPAYRHGYDRTRVMRAVGRLLGIGEVWVGDFGVKTGIRTDALVRDDDPDHYIYNPLLSRYPPQWSPDGRRIVYVLAEYLESRYRYLDEEIPQRLGSRQGWAWAVFTMNAGGRDVRRISGALSGVSWSPDGERLALVRVVGEDAALVTIAPDGTDLEVITWLSDEDVLGEKGREAEMEAEILNPRIDPISWSPDGSRILFRCGDRLCVVTLDGKRVEAWPLESVDEEDQFQAAWSPDGSRIAVYGEFDPRLGGRRIIEGVDFGGGARSDDRSYRIVLFTMAPDGSDVRLLLGRHGDGHVDVVDASGADGARNVRACAAGRIVANPEAHPELVRDCETLLRLRDTLA